MKYYTNSLSILTILLAGFLCLGNSCTPNKVKNDAPNTTLGVKTGKTKKINSSSKKGDCRFAFYNLENLFDSIDDPKTSDEDFLPGSDLEWTPERYQQKVENLAKVIQAVSKDGKAPNVMGFCEIENQKTLKDLINKVSPNGNFGFVHQESKDERGIDVALMYDKSLVEVKNQEFFVVNLKGDRTRDILYAETEIDSEPVHFFINHWSSRREGQVKSEPKRVSAASVVRNKINGLFKENPQAKIIIMGDFNDEPNNKSISEILQAQDQDNAIQAKALYNLSSNWKEEGLGTYFYDQWNTLDQIIVSSNLLKGGDGLHTQKDNAHIFNEEWLSFYDKKNKVYRPSRFISSRGKFYGGYSDHYPVYFDLSY